MCGVVVTALMFEAGRPGFKPRSDLHSWSQNNRAERAAFTLTPVNGKPFASSRIRTLNPQVPRIPYQLGNSLLGKSAHPGVRNIIKLN